jgi:hypothetical protein
LWVRCQELGGRSAGRDHSPTVQDGHGEDMGVGMTMKREQGLVGHEVQSQERTAGDGAWIVSRSPGLATLSTKPACWD